MLFRSPATAPLPFAEPTFPYLPPQQSTSTGINRYAYHNHTYAVSYGSSSTSPPVPSLSPPNTAGSSASSANSPETPLSFDVQFDASIEQSYCGTDQTLSLPIVHRQDFFTQDEILASEVLEVGSRRA